MKIYTRTGDHGETSLFGGARVAKDDPRIESYGGVDAARIEELERAIDAMTSELAPLTSFILPGGSLAAGQLHVARTVCRRAERLVVALQDDDGATKASITYL